MSVGGHQMTRAEKLSLPQLYNQYFHIAYYIRAGLYNPNSKPKTEIPKQVRDDKKTRPKPSCHAELVSASGLIFSAFDRRIFHPRPQDGVFRCAFNKLI